MTDRDRLARFNSLLSAGLSAEQAGQAAEITALSSQLSLCHRFLVCVSEESGASPLGAVRELERIAEQNFENQAKVRVSAAVPKATARLVLWLPLAAAALGQLTGLGSIKVFFESPLALVALLLGFMLLIGASIWSSRILASAHDESPADAIALDAMAMCLDAGLETKRAREICLRNFALCFNRDLNQIVQRQILELLQFSDLSGAPIAKLLRNCAEQSRRSKSHLQSEHLEILSVRLLAPMATLVLPAFVLIAVLPISISTLINS
jgi:tight adherence protein B